ncbi:MAG: lysoplasmalogenase family protein [Thermoleophilia bacterium]
MGVTTTGAGRLDRAPLAGWPPTGRWRLALGGLWLLWAALLFGGFLLGSPAEDSTHRMPIWTRMGSSAVLVLAAWAWFAAARRRTNARTSRSDDGDFGEAARGVRDFALLVGLGMTAGFAGDLILAGLLPGGENVLAGIAAFGIGHALYITAVLRWAGRRGHNDPRIRWTAFTAWWAIGAAAWYLVVFRGQEATVLHWAALPYALLLAGTCGAATGLAAQVRAFAPMAVGAALFLASDLILAAQLFNDVGFRLIGDVIWLTYGPGQMLIVYANAAARRGA